jgi:hypothetical protein
MKINFNSTDISFALLGGALIGIATTIHLLLKGRVTGFSGIYFSIISYDKTFIWKLSLLGAIISTSAIFYDIFKFDQIISGDNNVYAFD